MLGGQNPFSAQEDQAQQKSSAPNLLFACGQQNVGLHADLPLSQPVVTSPPPSMMNAKGPLPKEESNSVQSLYIQQPYVVDHDSVAGGAFVPPAYFIGRTQEGRTFAQFRGNSSTKDTPMHTVVDHNNPKFRPSLGFLRRFI